MRVVLVAGSTATAKIPGISAAGADPTLVGHTPSADAEIIEYGDTVRSPVTPVSPTGCPTPAAITRAVRELTGFDVLTVDAGLAKPTAAPTIDVGARPGRDIREDEPVPTAPGAFEAARRMGLALPEDELVIGETVPGGTTTALAVFRALGETFPVSSSLPENPTTLKEDVVAEALDSADLSPGDAAHKPELAARYVGDPVLPVVAGLTVGALEADIDVTLGGGTQLLAAAALVRHAGAVGDLTLATTSYLADDVPELESAAAELDVDLVVTDPGFESAPLDRYAAGEAKEGAGMGGALMLADRMGVVDDVEAATLDVLSRLDPQAVGGVEDGP
ncbi:nicotinate-nucleotide--dimethylbenzimidazole phosphoribosyltransferase [Haloferax sp. YSSS75]|uniref:nicotinate-nucleotide--dimethylbenzimidazole phosphoribosyltransferase n=1 Tax=Haloferax sp. YSSS75 TaxID=3388564 RepID=UPI00398D147C